jgi:tryptophan-rich sensory protein
MSDPNDWSRTTDEPGPRGSSVDRRPLPARALEQRPPEPDASAPIIAARGADIALLATWMVLCLGVGIIGSLPTPEAVKSWYPSLTLPVYTPPNEVFAPVWTVLYLTLGVVGFRLTKAVLPAGQKTDLLALFAMHLVLNMVWGWAFFGARDPMLGFLVMIVLLDYVLMLVGRVWRIDWKAALLMAPYTAWIGFATAINLGVVLLN